MSILQLFQAEVKIHCQSLLRQKAFHTLASLNISRSVATDNCADITEDLTWLKEWVLPAEVNKVSDHAALLFALLMAALVDIYHEDWYSQLPCLVLSIKRDSVENKPASLLDVFLLLCYLYIGSTHLHQSSLLVTTVFHSGFFA